MGLAAQILGIDCDDRCVNTVFYTILVPTAGWTLVTLGTANEYLEGDIVNILGADGGAVGVALGTSSDNTVGNGHGNVVISLFLLVVHGEPHFGLVLTEAHGGFASYVGIALVGCRADTAPSVAVGRLVLEVVAGNLLVTLHQDAHAITDVVIAQAHVNIVFNIILAEDVGITIRSIGIDIALVNRNLNHVTGQLAADHVS